MQKPCLIFLLSIFPFFSSPLQTSSAMASTELPAEAPASDLLYEEMKLEGVVGYMAFRQALEGYYKIDNKTKDILTHIDFSKPTTEERLYVLDMKNKKMLFKSVVSHGRNSGDNFATSFSNKIGSYQSSLGFYLTDKTYQGKNGYSLLLDGLEAGINDRARERAIVMHGAPYANPNLIASNGRLGRSLGCPAIPLSLTKSVINTIKEGSVLFIYANSKDYMAKSTFLSNKQTDYLSMN